MSALKMPMLSLVRAMLFAHFMYVAFCWPAAGGTKCFSCVPGRMPCRDCPGGSYVLLQ